MIIEIKQYEFNPVNPNDGIIINLDDFKINPFSLLDPKNKDAEKFNPEKLSVLINPVISDKKQRSTVIDLNYIHLNPKAEKEKYSMFFSPLSCNDLFLPFIQDDKLHPAVKHFSLLAGIGSDGPGFPVTFANKPFGCNSVGNQVIDHGLCPPL